MTSVVMPKEVLPAKIVGKAIYLELGINPDLDESDKRTASWYWDKNPSKQLIIFPAWTDDSGNTYPARYMSREISEQTPRSQWSFGVGISPIGELKDDPENSTYYSQKYYDYDNLKSDEIALMSEEDVIKATIKNANLIIRREMIATKWERTPSPTGELSDPISVAYQGWVVREDKPLAIEVTDEDMKLVRHSTTPQAVIRRINKVRATIDNFPEKLG